jgi:hypothetical protein
MEPLVPSEEGSVADAIAALAGSVQSNRSSSTVHVLVEIVVKRA